MPSRTHWLRRTLCASFSLLFATALTPIVEATQVVYLNFERTGGTSDVDYSQAARDSIQTIIEQDYAAWDFQFVQAEPTSGEFSTLFFNDGPGFGIAEGIDFRNANKSDNARIQTSSAFDPGGDMGVPINPSLFDTFEEFTRFTANVASHELGHIQGLRHRDALGPVGNGFSSDPDFMFGANFADPAYQGARAADQMVFHIMETGISQLSDEIPLDKYFGTREAIKLSFNEQGSVVPESPGIKQTIQQAQPLTLSSLDVPNTAEQGDVMRQEFVVDAVAVTGQISAALQRDFYSFQGTEGDVLNLEVHSALLGPSSVSGNGRYSNTIFARVSLFDSNGDPVDYYGIDAVNEGDFEGSPDPLLLDLVLPATDTYFVEVEALPDPFTGVNFDTGNYELFIHTFSAVELAPGDFNRDGIVDAADYTIWQDTEGDDVTPGTGADTDFNGKIDFVDYQKWVDNYGNTTTDVIPANALPGVGLATTVPEPTSALLTGLLLSLAGLAGRRAN